MSQPVFHRLHPGTILISMVQAVQRMILLIIYFGAQCFMGSRVDGAQMGEFAGAGIGLLIGLSAVIRYFIYGYAIHDGNLIIQDGWLTKKTRTIPLNRIQNINFKRGLIHRILNIVDVEIETAGGANAEASLSALSEDNAQRLKVLLTGENHLSMSPVMAARQDPLVYAASNKELFLAGATQNRALAIIAGLFGTFYFLFQGDQLERIVRNLAQSTKLLSTSSWQIQAAIGFAVLLLFGWLASIIMTFATYYGFELRRSEDKLKRSYGLISHIENVILIRRIQVVRLSETLVQRWLKLGSMHVDTAGGMAVAQQNEGGQQRAASPNSNLISPLIESIRVGGLLGVVLPGLNLADPKWQQISRRTITRRVRLGLIWNLPYAVFATAAIEGAQYINTKRDFLPSAHYDKQNEILILTAGLYVFFCIMSWIRAVLYYRTARWWDQGDVFVARTGVFSRSTWYAPIAKIQSIQIAQSPIQRRLGLASVTFRTAAMQGSAAVEVQDLPADKADEVVKSLHTRSAVHAWMNPDGF